MNRIPVTNIRLYNIRLNVVEVHAICDVKWSKVWAVSHVWDNVEDTESNIHGCTWKSKAFSNEGKCKLLINKASEEAERRGGCYIWMDSICINQDQEYTEEREEQILHMRTIFSESSGTIAFGPIINNKFSAIIDHDWVNVWFERVWTYQEMQLPKKLIFVSEDKVFTFRELYWLILLSSPYLNKKNINDTLNGMSRGAMLSTDRALIQANKRQASKHVDKIYGVLGAMDQNNDRMKTYRPNYKLSTNEAIIEIMTLMSHKDVMDTLMLNLKSNNLIHDNKHWSGMVSFDKEMDHPSYGSDIYYGTNAHIYLQNNFMYTSVSKVPVWKCKVKESHTFNTNIAPSSWPSMNEICNAFGISSNYNHLKIEYTNIGRVLRSINANIKNDDLPEKVFTMASNLLSKMPRGVEQPRSRIDPSLENTIIDIVICRSKKNKMFHYGICITKNADDSWHKLCTVSFREDDMHILEKKEQDIIIGA